MSKRFVKPSRKRTSDTVIVTRHEGTCAVWVSAGCDCGALPEIQTYVRVCANCGGDLRDRKKPYCSPQCRHDMRVRSKNSGDRQESDRIHFQGHSPP